MRQGLPVAVDLEIGAKASSLGRSGVVGGCVVLGGEEEDLDGEPDENGQEHDRTRLVFGF